MINQIRYSNLKGQTNVQELTGKDIFIGANGSGKTTRIQALGLSMLGYIPGNGRTAAETFKLATGDEMSVGLTVDAFHFDRTFKKAEKTERKTGKTSVSISESLAVSPGQGEKNDTERKARVVTEIDSFPVAMDYNEFLGLSDAKRRDFMYGLSPIKSDTWTKNKVHEYLKENLLSMELEINNSEQYQTMEETIAEAVSKFPDRYDIHQGLQSMIDYVTNQKSAWESKKKDSQGAVRSIADAKNQLAETDRNIAEAKQELEDLQEQLIAMEKQISKDTERKRINDNRITRIKDLKQQIEDYKNSEVSTDTTEIDKQIEKLKEMVKEVPEVSMQVASLKAEIETSNKTLKDKVSAITAVEKKLSEVNFELQSLKKALDKVGDLEGRCIVHNLIKCPKDFAGFDSFVEKRIAESKHEIDNLSQVLKTLKTEEAELEDKIQNLEKQKEEAYTKSQTIIDSNNRIERQIMVLEKEKDIVNTSQERYENKLKTMQDELTRLMNEPVEASAPIDILEKQIEGIRERKSLLRQQVDEKEKAKQTILLLQKSMIENKQAEYKAVSFKAINEALGPKGIQGELVKEILEPIRSDIKDNLNSMGFDFEPYFDTESDTGKEVFQFGWINEKGHKVNFDALSTGQQTAFLAAMMMTILDRANPKIKILAIDNLNHLDRKNLQLVIDGIDKLSHRVDNIILAGAIEYDFKAKGWNVVDLSQKVVAKSA